jgi:hypothetical protein
MGTPPLPFAGLFSEWGVGAGVPVRVEVPVFYGVRFRDNDV